MRLLLCAYMAAARLIELAISRRNIAAFRETEEGQWSRRSFPLIAALHALVIGGTLLLGERRARPRWLLPLFLAQLIRFWVLATLGRRWNARAAVPAEMDVETSGPYAFVRHPNYAVVGVELFCLPATFGRLSLAILASCLNALLLAGRIREEEALLGRLPGYCEHFEGKARFVPGLF